MIRYVDNELKYFCDICGVEMKFPNDGYDFSFPKRARRFEAALCHGRYDKKSLCYGCAQEFAQLCDELISKHKNEYLKKVASLKEDCKNGR